MISIIIPTFNRAALLPNAVDSVLAQTEKDWELIIVDDGSKDETKDVLTRYEEIPKIKVRLQENQGVAAARNAGAEMATGDYLIFLDSDDEFYPSLLKTLKNIRFWEYDVICWQVQKITNGREGLWKPRQLGKLYNNIVANFLAGSVCYKKDLFFAVKGFDTNLSFGENYELGLRVSHKAGLQVKVIHEPLLQYNFNSGNRSSGEISDRISSYYHLIDKHEQLYEKNSEGKSVLYHLIGEAHKKRGENKLACSFFLKSWLTYPINPKPLLKFLYLTILK